MIVSDGALPSTPIQTIAEIPRRYAASTPDAIALSYWNVLQQPRSAWTWEVELRPWVEKF